MKSKRLNLTREQRLIELIKGITGENLIGDDCAVLPGARLVSSDMLVQGKHFLLPQMSYEDLGWKAMAVNLSDIAAMAGVPEFAVVSIAMPPQLSDEEFGNLYESMNECAVKYGTRIVGGDLTGSESLVISITVIGRCNNRGVALRSAARIGDLVIATGDFGASALGLELILRGKKTSDAHLCYAIQRHLRPEPKFGEAHCLLEISAQVNELPALMDASDGLADALLQMAAASDVGIEVEEDKIPVHHEVSKMAAELGLDVLDLALYGGEDYELVACVEPSVWEKMEHKGDSSFKIIGKVVAGDEVVLRRRDGTSSRVDERKTFQHWRERA